MSGLCECGCGEPTPLAKQTRTERGQIQGQPVRFIVGHTARLPRSPEHVANQARVRVGRAIPSLRAENHPFWKGSQASYSAIHKWLNTHYPRGGTCERCGTTSRRTHYAFTQHGSEYTRNRDDYLELCNGCHKWFDGYVAEKGWHNGGWEKRVLYTQGRLP